MSDQVQLKEKGETGERAEDAQNAQPPRHAGMLAAVAVTDDEHQQRAIAVLRTCGAAEIERAEGTIANGDWNDFNALATPVLIQNVQGQRV